MLPGLSGQRQVNFPMFPRPSWTCVDGEIPVLPAGEGGREEGQRDRLGMDSNLALPGRLSPPRWAESACSGEDARLELSLSQDTVVTNWTSKGHRAGDQMHARLLPPRKKDFGAFASSVTQFPICKASLSHEGTGWNLQLPPGIVREVWSPSPLEGPSAAWACLAVVTWAAGEWLGPALARKLSALLCL